MWIAKFESPNFSFTAYAKTEAQARAYLLEGLETHAQQYDLALDWYYPEEIYTMKISPGCYRDNSRMGGKS